MKSPVPANQLAKRVGIKLLAYGGPGTGKTPIASTAPTPVIIAMEPGILSLRKSTIPVIEAYDAETIAEVFKWISTSQEARKYQTLCFDSASQMAEIIFKSEKKKTSNLQRAYGQMAEKTMEYLNTLYFLQGPNVYIIAKQDTYTFDGETCVRPYFPGQQLDKETPYLYDVIVRVENVPMQDGSVAKGFRTAGSKSVIARDRFGVLDALEPANLTQVFDKIAKG